MGSISEGLTKLGAILCKIKNKKIKAVIMTIDDAELFFSYNKVI
jgi:hypothetical protein